MGKKINVEIEMTASGFGKKNCKAIDPAEREELSKVFSGEDFKL